MEEYGWMGMFKMKTHTLKMKLWDKSNNQLGSVCQQMQKRNVPQKLKNYELHGSRN